jgi:hypothetical protein
MARSRPSVFVGSSAEGLKIAKALQVLLDHACEVAIWSQGVFGLSQGTLESLVRALDQFDFAVLVLTADDLVTSRDVSATAPRDNVLFELGLFMGGLGQDRTFIVYDRTSNLKLPSDLAGVTAATFEPHSSGNLQSALGAAATRIEDKIERLGLKDRERLKVLSQAAEDFDTAASQMHKLIELIARSRKVELDIITSPLLSSLLSEDQVEQVKQDHGDLERTLRQQVENNIEKLEERRQRLHERLAHDESRLHELDSKRRGARSDDSRAVIESWIIEAKEKIRSIRDQIEQMDNSIEKERSKLR